MYEIDIIPQDIREEEAIHRILDTMKDLRTIMDTIFVNIDSKIDQFQDRLKGIDSRCEQAQQMINKLQGAGGKVTRIFSEFKFPAKDVFKSYSPLSPTFTSTSQPVIRKMKSTHVPFDDELLKTKIQFPIALSDKDSSYNSIIGSESKQVPWNRIKNIGSLVIFNSSENPYAASPIASSTVENKAKNRKHPQNDDDDDAITNLAPTAMLTKDQLDSQDDFIRYNPDSQLAPKIMDDLPSALPHLSGIADGLLFNETNESLTSNQQDLPDLGRIGFEPPPESPKVDMFRNEKSLPPLPGSSAIPPPPPPPPPSFFSNTSSNSELSNKKSEATVDSRSSSIPPPPPLPSILPSDLSGSEKAQPQTSLPSSAISPPPLPPSVQPPPQPILPPSTDSGTAQKKLPVITNDREGLLASIREAGGRPTRKPGNIKERKIEEKKKDQAEIQGDIMSALQKKLNDRRKGISGRNLEPGADRTSLMEAADLMKSRLPQASSSASSSDLSDADWNDI